MRSERARARLHQLSIVDDALATHALIAVPQKGT